MVTLYRRDFFNYKNYDLNIYYLLIIKIVILIKQKSDTL